MQLEAPADQRPSAFARARDLVHLIFARSHDAVATAALGEVQRLVRLAEGIVEVGASRGCRHTEARGDRHRVFGNEVGLHDPLTQLLGQVRGLREARTRAHEDELFTTPATEAVGVASVHAQDLADRLQHAVAVVVSAMVVDALEVIEIDDDHARRQIGDLQ